MKPNQNVRIDPNLEKLKPEIRTYLRELPQLVAEGHQGRCVLIKGDEVLSIWDTEDDACQAALERLGLGVTFLAQPIKGSDLELPFPADYWPQATKTA